MQELENIDDEADQLGIGFVKISDEALADEYNLGELPKLVYYRHQTPIIYESMYFSCQEISALLFIFVLSLSNADSGYRIFYLKKTHNTAILLYTISQLILISHQYYRPK